MCQTDKLTQNKKIKKTEYQKPRKCESEFNYTWLWVHLSLSLFGMVQMNVCACIHAPTHRFDTVHELRSLIMCSTENDWLPLKTMNRRLMVQQQGTEALGEGENKRRR